MAGPGRWFRGPSRAAPLDIAPLDSIDGVRPVPPGPCRRPEMGPRNHHPGPATPAARRSAVAPILPKGVEVGGDVAGVGFGDGHFGHGGAWAELLGVADPR